MGNENGYKDYMEGEYDGENAQKAEQEVWDRVRAENLAQHAEVRMESAWMAERERIAAETGERGAALDAIMNQYLKEDKYQQYLVDGAILRCENATLDDFELPTGEKVVLEGVTDQSDTERTHIKLCVSENVKDNDLESLILVGGLAYATVKDTIKGKNIIPPCCNCKVAINRDKEAERIMADPERNKQGVCRHLMQLNDEWRNLWKQGQSYLSKTNRVPTTMTAGFGEMSAGNYLSEKVTGGAETVLGITMTSMLFCKHGGIIMPVTSGQETLPNDDQYKYMKEQLQEVTSIDNKFDGLIKEFIEAYIKSEAIYRDLAEKVGIPAELLAVIHYRENSTDYLNGTFNVYLHNGEPLGKETEKEPDGLLFHDFETAAIDAIQRESSIVKRFHLSTNSNDLVAMLCFAECYNGTGYYNNGHINPYIFSGTNVYVSGKYVEIQKTDGSGTTSVYKADLVDEQVGAYLLFKALMEYRGENS